MVIVSPASAISSARTTRSLTLAFGETERQIPQVMRPQGVVISRSQSLLECRLTISRTGRGRRMRALSYGARGPNRPRAGEAPIAASRALETRWKPDPRTLLRERPTARPTQPAVPCPCSRASERGSVRSCRRLGWLQTCALVFTLRMYAIRGGGKRSACATGTDGEDFGEDRDGRLSG
jgi:hypothetical protein